jgi:cytochrome P450
VDSARSYHPADPVAAVDPWSALADLRQECPVASPVFQDFPPIKLVTRYSDIRPILTDAPTFANIGTAMSVAEAEAVPFEQRKHFQLNGADHKAVRRLLLAAVGPRPIRRAMPRLISFGREIVDAFVDRGSADLVADWSARYPAAAIASVLGLPDEDADKIHQWVDSDLDAGARAAEAKGVAFSDRLMVKSTWTAYLLEHIRQRRNAKGDSDDGITRMIEYRTPAGRAFNDEELVLHIHSLLIAGNETTTSMMGNLMYRILMEPGQFESFRQDRSLIESSIEESLRFDPPVQSVNRACTKEVEVNGHTLVPNEVVCTSISSANRDVEIWGDDADQFRPDRFRDPPENDHLAFGFGVHYCPGAFLARTSARISVNALLDAISEMRLAPSFEYEKRNLYLIRGPIRMPVEFTPARA